MILVAVGGSVILLAAMIKARDAAGRIKRGLCWRTLPGRPQPGPADCATPDCSLLVIEKPGAILPCFVMIGRGADGVSSDLTESDDSTRWIMIGCAAVLVSYVVLIGIIWNIHGILNLPDFTVFWAAGRLAVLGHPAAAYNPIAVAQLQPIDAIAHDFRYPPSFLLFLEIFGYFTYKVSATLYLSSMLVVYLTAAWIIVKKIVWFMIAVVAPVVLFNVISGQNGLLLVALLGLGLVWLDRRPIVAGALLGLVAFKPQFGILLPLFLLATMRWRVFLSAGLTALFINFLGYIVLGAETYVAFFGRLAASANDSHTSLYSLFCRLGLSSVTAIILHSVIAVAVALWSLFMSINKVLSQNLKRAALVIGALAVSPYSNNGDFTLLLLFSWFLVDETKTSVGNSIIITAINMAMIFSIKYPLPFLIVSTLIFYMPYITARARYPAGDDRLAISA